MKIKTSELTATALDWAVAKCESTDGRLVKLGGGWNGAYFIERENYPNAGGFHRYTPSTNWAQGGPIIDGENISLHPVDDIEGWSARKVWGDKGDYTGPTPLIAAMRCYVSSRLGDEVDVPEELK